MGNNTSNEAGYLVPVGDGPLEGEQLWDFIQTVIVGVTGLDGKMVRPRYTSEPTNIPNAGQIWCAYSIGERPADTFPQVEHVTNGGNPDGADLLQRQEELRVLTSFYDLGSNGEADKYVSRLRDGLVIAQNREVMLANGFDFAYSGNPLPVPSLAAERWLYRVDLELVFRRQINRTYQVLNLDSARATLNGQSGIETVIVDEIIVEQ